MCTTWRIYVNDMTRFFVFFSSCSLTQSSMWQVPRINLWFDLLTFIWHVLFMCVSRLIHIWHSFVLPDALMRATTAPNRFVLWLIDMYVTWRIYMRVMTHSYLTCIWLTWRIRVFHTWPFMCVVMCCTHDHTSDRWCVAFICVKWLVRLTWLTHVCVKCSLLICVTCQIQTCYMTHCVSWLMHMCYLTVTLLCDCCSLIIRVIFLIHMWDISHSHVWHDSFMCVI